VTEPTKIVPGYIIISPDDPECRRTWPDPRASEEARWKASHDPTALTLAEIRQLATAAQTYAHIFGISQRQFLPTHSAIRAALSADAHLDEAS
jgi:hypothetical protein